MEPPINGNATQNELWKNECPMAYRSIDLNKIPAPKDIVDKIMEWDASKGLLIYGESRKGKTRLAWEILRRQFIFHNKTIKAFDAIDFSVAVQKAYTHGDQSDFYLSLTRPSIVFLDDLGKSKITIRVGEALFGLVDKRLARNKISIFTMNFTSEQFMERFEDKVLGIALFNRIKEECICIKV